jgi:hypothetical protein
VPLVPASSTHLPLAAIHLIPRSTRLTCCRRKSKVKCSQHHGNLPCRPCQRSGRTLKQCVLQTWSKKARSSALRPTPFLPTSSSAEVRYTGMAFADAQDDTRYSVCRGQALDDDGRGFSLADLLRANLMEAPEPWPSSALEYISRALHASIHRHCAALGSTARQHT